MDIFAIVYTDDMKKVIAFAALLLVSFSGEARNPKVWRALKKDINIFVVSDSGRNGYYLQKPVAELMGRMAESISPDYIVTTGDVHHFEGVQSVHDPLWMTNYELIYSHPKLMVPWLAALGNHEYRGDTNAVLDYSNISRRWVMPDRYYTKVYKEDGASIRLIIIDTSPLISRYRKSKANYKDAYLQSEEAQVEWLDSVLKSATEDWIVVAGHHPIYADTSKSKKERTDLQQKVDTVMRKYGNVDMYLCGHIHNFQHIRVEGSDIDYIVNSSAALSRDVEAVEGTQFCSPKVGFSVVTADKESICLHMIDDKGRVLHTVTRTK